MNRLPEILLIILISPFLFYGAAHFTPGINGFVVKSGSMEPEIKTGSIIFTKSVNPDKVAVGDTVTYSDGDHFVTHRVIEKNSSDNRVEFITKGVANEEPDPESVSGDQIAGKKIIDIPFLGYMVAWVGTVKGFLAFVVLPGVIVTALELREIRKSFAEEEKN